MFKPNTAKNPEDYIRKIAEPRKSEIQQLHNLILTAVPKLKPFMISGMIGYGKYRYKYASGKEGDWCTIALASQKNYISVYVCATKDGMYIAEEYKDRLGKVNVGRSCIRFKRVGDVDLQVLIDAIKEGETYPMSAV